ncbi:MAG: excinuclease ABC subunit A, partial [Muribaculaceae bacterium]|nr:excinuclease ABC subunit A [Muribaculaceae bacterium]
MFALAEIEAHGVRVNNLKNVDVMIPRNKLVVITGLSGSGKSSLAFDTLYAEGRRRYVESLSAYARQFMGKMRKPEADKIAGLPPAIAIEQKVNTRNPRSTVGTSTEIYDYMRLLFGRVGRTFSPVSGCEVKKHSVNDVLEAAARIPDGTRMAVVAPLAVPEGRTPRQHLEVLLKGGYTRLFRHGRFE